MTIWRLFAAAAVLVSGAGVALADPDANSPENDGPPPSYMLENPRLPVGGMAVQPGAGVFQLRTNIVPSGTLNVGPVVNYSREKTDFSDRRIDNLSRVDPGWEAGAFVDYRIDNDLRPNTVVGLNFQFAADVAGSHGGWRFLPNVYYRTPLGESWNFRAGLYSTFAIDNYVSTSSGAGTNTAARRELDGGDGDAGFKDVGIGVGMTYNLTPSWNVDTALRYERLLDDAAEGPVTNDQGSANQLFGGVLVRYKF